MEINHTHNGTDLNNPQERAHLSHSKVTMHPDFNHTLRFGENTPHFAMEVVPSDEKFQFRCSHNINSYTLKAPLGQSVELHKDYFLVPHQCLLPLNSEKILQAPKTGDDVPEDADTVTRNLWRSVRQALELDYTDSVWSFVKLLWVLRTFYSRGSLINYLGYSPERAIFNVVAFGEDIDGSADDILEFYIPVMLSGRQITITLSGYENDPLTFNDNYPESGDFSTRRDFIEFVFSHISDIISFQTDFSAGFSCHYLGRNPIDQDPFNYDKLCAYQIVNSHYYTNDNVDYVYNSDMFRQYIKALVNTYESELPTFEWNGINMQYDSLSGRFMDAMLARLPGAIIGGIEYQTGLAYFDSIFGFRQSLRFVDYFTGARTRPLAVGEEGVAVQEGFVNAVDMAREMQRVRYLNAVGKSGRNPEDYNESLFGTKMDYDYHNPMWLASTSDVIYNSITENTGSEQYDSDSIAKTGEFKSNANRFAFEVNVDVYGIVIGIEYCDIKRVYTDVRDRSFFVANRYDRFIPQMQFIGDQPIYKKELGYDFSIDSVASTFGYTTRDMHYKCAVSRAVGGFDGALPGWSFVANPSNFGKLNHLGMQINPEFIRARSTEFDQFYLRLSGFSPRNYFHFIVFQVNDIEIYRPMIQNPQILA